MTATAEAIGTSQSPAGASAATPAPAAGGSATPAKPVHLPAQESAAGNHDAAMDAAFEELAGKDEPGVSLDDFDTPPTGETPGASTPDAGESTASSETATENAEKKADEPKPELDRAARRKIVAAKDIVARVLKYDDEQLDKMPHEQLMDLAQRAEEVHDAFERTKTDLHKWKDRARGQKAPDADTPDNDRGRSPETSDSADRDGAERQSPRIDQTLREVLDDETYKAYVRDKTAERSKYENDLRAAGERATQAEHRYIATVTLSTIERLAEKFPSLKDAGTLDRFVAEIDKADPRGERALGDPASFSRWLNGLAWAEFGEGMERTTRQGLIASNRRTVNAQPEVGASPASPRPMTAEQYEEYAYEAAAKYGHNPAKLKEVMAKIPLPAKAR